MRIARTGGLVVLATVAAAFAAGCGGSSASGTTTDTETTETTAASEAKVTSFDVGGLDCKSTMTGSGQVSVAWATTDATAVELEVDGSAPGAAAGYGPSGSTQISVPCDNEAHTISITALSDAGAGETKSEEITPG